MATPFDAPVTPNCFLAHDLVNKLTVILAECEQLQPETTNYSESKRVRIIHELATQMAEKLVCHQCALDEVLRNQVVRKTESGPPRS